MTFQNEGKATRECEVFFFGDALNSKLFTDVEKLVKEVSPNSRQLWDVRIQASTPNAA